MENTTSSCVPFLTPVLLPSPLAGLCPFVAALETDPTLAHPPAPAGQSTDRDSRFAKLMSAQLLIDVDADEPAPAEEAAAAAAEAPAPTTTAGKQKQAEEKPHLEGKLVR